jgi:hypothetical protein
MASAANRVPFPAARMTNTAALVAMPQACGASVPEVIRVCGQQLLFLYAWQNQPELGQLPGHGPTDFAPWLQALARVNYPGFVNAFMHGHVEADAMSAALTQSRDYLRQCAKT